MTKPLFEDRPLPYRIRRALDAVVKGPGRIPTTAHPDCICHKPTGRIVTRKSIFDFTVTWQEPEVGNPADCPQHRPEPKP